VASLTKSQFSQPSIQYDFLSKQWHDVICVNSIVDLPIRFWYIEPLFFGIILYYIISKFAMPRL